MHGWVVDVNVYVVPGVTDLRKAIDGLSMYVEEQLELDPFSGHLFAFCNRRRDMVKVLYWDRNGFCMWQKRLERERFEWPRTGEAALKVDMRHFEWLLEGFRIYVEGGHGRYRYQSVI